MKHPIRILVSLACLLLLSSNLQAQEAKSVVAPMPKKIALKYDASGNRIERTDGNLTVTDPSGPANPNGGGTDPGQEFLTFRGTQSTIKIYPNPTAVILCVDIPPSDEEQQGDLLLYNNKGQLIVKKQVVSGSNYTFDLSGQPNGTYHLNLKIGTQTIKKTVIKSE